MSAELILFPDTNLFLQCKSIPEITWSDLGEFDVIKLFVSRPVQAEIDNLKAKGNARLAQRSRTASSLFRQALLSESNFVEIRNGKTRVQLYLRPELKTESTLEDVLSYEERDHQLVGITAAYAIKNPGQKVSLLTHDLGPMASAKMVGVKFIEIPDTWFLPAEADETEKKLNTLKADLARYKNLEPSFEVLFKGMKDDGPTLEADVIVYLPLEEKQVFDFLASLRSAFPIATESEMNEQPPPEKSNTGVVALFLGTAIFRPPSAEAVAHYLKHQYPKWINECEVLLRNLHLQLQEWPELDVQLNNQGSRPADSALITFSSRGPFSLFPPKDVDEEDVAGAMDICFPAPPTPPRGEWTNSIPSLFGMANAYQMGRDLLPVSRSFKREKDAFYYKSRPTTPVPSFQLECEQWRHQTQPESFLMTIHFDKNQTDIQGALEVTVQSSNMTDPFICVKPIRLTTQHVSAYSYATTMFKQLRNKR